MNSDANRKISTVIKNVLVKVCFSVVFMYCFENKVLMKTFTICSTRSMCQKMYQRRKLM